MKCIKTELSSFKILSAALLSTFCFLFSGAVFAAEAGNIPEQLFDINLTINDETINSIDELSANAVFVSFGKIPTPVDLIFAILDSNGKKVYEAKDNIVVETEYVLNKQFNGLGLNLAPGKYTLILTTIYNVKIKDDFKQKFEIVEGEINSNFWKTGQFWILILIIIAVLAVIIKKSKDILAP